MTSTSIAIDRLHPSPANPRADVGDVTELAASIAAVGLLEPLVVRANDNGFEVVCGARRLAAATKAGLKEVACTVRELDDEQALEAAVTENLQRVDLSILEEAAAYQALVGLGYTQRKLATRLGKSQAHISRRLSLLKLPEKAVAALDAGNITVEQATAVARLPKGTAEKLFKSRTPSEWEITAALRDHENAEKRAAALKDLAAAGATVLERNLNTYQHWIGGTWGNLAGLDVEQHSTEPCHAAHVSSTGSVQWYCTDPDRHDPDGASALKVPIEPDEDEREAETPEPGETSEEFRQRSEAAAAAKAQRDAVVASRREAITARRTYAGLVIDKLDAGGVIDLLAMALGDITYIEEPFEDRMVLELLGITPDTYNQTTAADAVKAFMGKGSRNRTRALGAVAVAALERDATPAGGEWQMGADRWVVDEEFADSTRAWLAFLVKHGYALSDHDRGLIPEARPPTEPQPDDAVAWYDDPEEGPRWVDESEADAIEALDDGRLHRVEVKADNDAAEHLGVSATITVTKSGKRWKATCSACGELGANTSEEYANERGQTHVDLDHRLVDAEAPA